MRILVYGAGVQGCQLAHSLAQNKKNQCFTCDTEDIENSVVLRRTRANRARRRPDSKKGKNEDVRREA